MVVGLEADLTGNPMKTPATTGDKHLARVYLAQARARRHQPAFHATLLQWAANARRRAMLGNAGAQLALPLV